MKYIIEICVAIDIAILGIAYPILIDKISNIGQKYKSEYLPNVFESEFPDTKIYRRVSILQLILILTLLTFIFQIFSFEPFKCFGNNVLIENSADIILFLFTLVLTITFLIWLNKIILYQGKASDLLKYLISKYNNTVEESQAKTYLLKTINEFSLYAIEQQDSHLQKSLMDFYYEQFQKYRSIESEYPYDLCNITLEIIETAINNPKSKLKALEHRASSGLWLLGESYQFSKISSSTYKWLWRNLVSSSSHASLIGNYWASASQYFNYSLNKIRPEYKGDNTENKEEIEGVKKERVKFLELNYALGGLLYFKKNYNGLRYILTFTQSLPASYPLLPQTMDAIFYWFDKFSNEYSFIDEPIEFKYSFPGLDNFGNSKNISHNICMYIAVLYLRQFTQSTIYGYQNFKIFHKLTDNLQDLYSYNDRLNYFKRCIKAVLENGKLLEILNYKINKPEVFETFDKLSRSIKQKIDLTKLKAQISVEKVKKFENETNRIIASTFESYNEIINSADFDDVDNKIMSSINGELTVGSKSSFTDIDIPNINFDVIYADYIANEKIKYFLPNTFLIAKTDNYLIERKLVLEALSKIIGNSFNTVVIGIRLSYDTKEILKEFKHKDRIIEIESTNNFLNDTFFILDKGDLPKFESRTLPKEEIVKFKLTEVNAKYKIYTSVIDVNIPENNNLKNEYFPNAEDELKVLISISFIFLIKWKKSRKIVMLSLTDPFQEKGIVDNLADIKENFTN